MNWKGMTGKKVSKANHKNTTSALTIQNQIQNIKIKINSLGKHNTNILKINLRKNTSTQQDT